MTIGEKLVSIAENEKKVYDAGERKGYFDGYGVGFADGRKRGFAEGQNATFEDGVNAERKSFWERYLHGGERTDMWGQQNGIFYGKNFGFNNFYPTCDIKPRGDATRLFYNWNTENGDARASLKQRLEECGVKLDTSKATTLTYAFSYCNGITELPTIDCTGLVGESRGVFERTYGYMHTIEKIIVKEDTIFTTWFQNANLTNVAFEGVIGQNLDFSFSTRLSADSIRNIIEHLSDTSEGKTLTLSSKAVENADLQAGVLLRPGALIGGAAFFSEPIPLKAGESIKVELSVADDHFLPTATYDKEKYDDKMMDPAYYGIALCSPYGATLGSIYPIDEKSYVYTAKADEDFNAKAYIERYTIDDTSPSATCSIRAVLVDANGEEVTGENLYRAEERTSIFNVGGWEMLVESKPNWTISLV